MNKQCIIVAAAIALSMLAFGSAQVSAQGAASGAKNVEKQGLLCRRAAQQAERAHRFPAQLLSAISLVEAGRWHAGTSASFAWPWTVTAQGKGRFLPSKAAAIATVRKLRARGVRNIDVGCMQINLMYHGKAFKSLDHAFDPRRNVAYAVRFLAKLKRETRSWTRTIGRYHSKTPARAKAYRKKVNAQWRQERRRVMQERSAKARAAWKARRARRAAARG